MYNPSYSPYVPASEPCIKAAASPRFHQLHSEDDDAVRTEIERGLRADRPSISPKYLYDELGSNLFTAITQLPEYYPTRCEREIVERHATEIARHVGPVRSLIDLGAGDCAKAERLFPYLAPAQYVPVDISVEYLRQAVDRLGARYTELDLVAVGTDFFETLSLPPDVGETERLFFYPGSSIGNLAPDHAAGLLKRIREACAGGGLLIGVDLVKSRALLEPAYDDPLGVTAAFNLNTLRHANRIIDADFDVAQWSHVAFYNEAQARIEMHLQAETDLTVTWPRGQRSFARGQRIHTENSYKYWPSTFKAMLERAGFHNVRYWTDEREWFALFGARA
ncbi:L-histidine N(alpha)-methyltransferase [Bordetella genomosp. 10]|uniref:L-histidine N(Alpha)-methyltransferase n=1 Tax=Bordetella genomosp. 10 TaxID=1416804 RepID=A0A261SC33_9BORD|nr:L-histidine N(alpha)-methyltransferase [Bordetella genomosp. 10]OZI33953.1 L-histidine N(alpha)-methyltransferase [Bordetella genomosp. 10]